MSRLKKNAPAYEKFAEAQKMANDKNWKQAVALAKQATKIEPKEGHFHSFLGDVSIKANNYKAAKTYFDRAINVNPEFFYYHVRRGQVNQKNGVGVEGSGPTSYVTVKQGLSGKGTFAIQLINNTSRPVTGIKLGVVMDGKRTTSNVDGVLGAGATKVIDTGRKMSQRQASEVQLEVLDAVAQ